MLCYLTFFFFRSSLNSPLVGASGVFCCPQNPRLNGKQRSGDCVYVFQVSSWCWRPHLLQWLPRRATRAMPTPLQATLLHPPLATPLNLQRMASTCKGLTVPLLPVSAVSPLHAHLHTLNPTLNCCCSGSQLATRLYLKPTRALLFLARHHPPLKLQ